MRELCGADFVIAPEAEEQNMARHGGKHFACPMGAFNERDRNASQVTV